MKLHPVKAHVRRSPAKSPAYVAKHKQLAREINRVRVKAGRSLAGKGA